MGSLHTGLSHRKTRPNLTLNRAPNGQGATPRRAGLLVRRHTQMRFCPEYCINVPDDFPVDELTRFMAATRRVLLKPLKGSEWKEFAGASNLIGWRFRAASEEREAYNRSWNDLGVSVPHEVVS